MKHRYHLHRLIGIYIIAVGLFLFLLFLNFYPIRGIFEGTLAESTKIYDRNGVLLYETLHPEQGKTTEVALDQIPKHLLQATIAVEDQNFYMNSGIDFGGIMRAIFLNVKSGEIVSGGSTITQQLVRNVIGINKQRTVMQKIKESLLALRVAKVFSKDEVLQLYFNKIYYGNLNYGILAASRGYFGKDVSDLDLAESAFLAGLPQAPSRYDPYKHRDDALKRKNYVLSLMRRQGFITETAMKQAEAEPLMLEQNLVTVRAPHFVNYVIGELESRFGDSFISAGLSVKTTLDYSMQQKVQQIARRNIALLAGRNVTNASVVILDPHTADILTMLGSIDYFDKKIDGNVNIATARRQPGSAMKPITYAATFEKGWTGATLIEDAPARFFTADGTPYTPKNYDYEYHGMVTVREALANSYNIPAVKAIHFASVDAVLQKARVMGLETLTESADHYGLALTLGDAEIRLVDLASVYMIFDNGGLKKDPLSIAEVRDSKGNLLYEKGSQPAQRVLGEDVSFMITDILSDASARIHEFGLNNVLELSRPAAAKTGTTRDFRDNWTFGYTPDFVTGVWVGNNDNSQMHNISGIYGAGPIWHEVMEEIHRGRPKKSFSVPASVEKKEFCIEGGIDGKPCTRTQQEWVAKKFQKITPSSIAEKPKLRIKKPFDLDSFKWDPHTDPKVQQIKFEIDAPMSHRGSNSLGRPRLGTASSLSLAELRLGLEKEKSVGEVLWFVNSEQVGKGDAIFWQLSRGDFEIQAKSADETNVVPMSHRDSNCLASLRACLESEKITISVE